MPLWGNTGPLRETDSRHVFRLHPPAAYAPPPAPPPHTYRDTLLSRLRGQTDPRPLSPRPAERVSPSPPRASPYVVFPAGEALGGAAPPNRPAPRAKSEVPATRHADPMRAGRFAWAATPNGARRVRQRQEATFWELFDQIAFRHEGRGGTRRTTDRGGAQTPFGAAQTAASVGMPAQATEGADGGSGRGISGVLSAVANAATVSVRSGNRSPPHRDRLTRSVGVFRPPTEPLNARSRLANPPPPPPPYPMRPNTRVGGSEAPNTSLRVTSLSDGYVMEAALAPDVDHMTYEELLDLAERIGRVERGVSPSRLLALRVILQPSHFETLSPVVRRRPNPARSPPTAYTAETSQSDDQSTLSCCVCLDSFFIGDVTTQLPCCHHFLHEGCASRWFESQFRCPICTRDVRVTS